MTLLRTLFNDPTIFERAQAYSPSDEIDSTRLPLDVARAVPKRQREFLAGRNVATRALAALAPEHEGTAIGTGPLREPQWPAGIVGSITHAAGYAAAAVAWTRHHAGIGIDAEALISPETGAEVVSAILRPSEQRRHGADLTALTIAFSAKESLYKCLSPLVRQVFDLHDAEVDQIDVAEGWFSLRLLRDLAPAYAHGWSTRGRLALDGGLVFTGIALPPGDP